MKLLPWRKFPFQGLRILRSAIRTSTNKDRGPSPNSSVQSQLNRAPRFPTDVGGQLDGRLTATGVAMMILIPGESRRA
jgi:hypothetical protein